MMPEIRNMNDLIRSMEPIIKEALSNTADLAKEVIESFLIQYYDGYSPQYYKRTYQFLTSCVKGEVEGSNGTYSVKIFIDTDNMNYAHGISGLQVAQWANEGKHGSWEVGDGTKFWKDAMDEIDRLAIIAEFKKYARKQGYLISVK